MEPNIKRLIDRYGNWFLEEAWEKETEAPPDQETRELLFRPLQINEVRLKNRIGMAPMDNVQMCDRDGNPTEKMVSYFRERAEGGVGLITCGMVPVCGTIDPVVNHLARTSGVPRVLKQEKNQAAWRRVFAACQACGAKFFVQLSPGMGRVGSPECLSSEGRAPISASANPSFHTKEVICSPLTDEEGWQIIKNAGIAACAVREAGADGVYLHGHEGYLLDEMTNPAYNHRRAGSFTDWRRFGLELVREIRRTTGEAFPIMYRINLSLALEETYGEELRRPELYGFRGGRSPEQTFAYMEELVENGVDAFDVDLGSYETWWLPHPPASMPPGCFLPVSRMVREYFQRKGLRSNRGLEIPIAAVGKLGFSGLAANALKDGDCDLILIGRALLADPDWAEKVRRGREEEIRPCIGCQEACINEYEADVHLECAVNPRTGFEEVFLKDLPPAFSPKKVAVVGAGPAGVTVAETALARGHEVTLFEASGKVGGRLAEGSVPKIKFELKRYREYLERTVARFAEKEGFSFEAREADAAELKAAGFDGIVLAVGAAEREPDPELPGIGTISGIQAVELLRSGGPDSDVRKVVVVGGGIVGCETAYWLSYEKSLEVTVVEMADYFMDGVCIANRGHLIHYLKRAGVRLLNGARVVGLCPSGVLIDQNTSETVPDPYVTWNPILSEELRRIYLPAREVKEIRELLPADLVVWAMGNRPRRELMSACERCEAAPELYEIGDCFHPGKVLNAVRSAYRLALAL